MPKVVDADARRRDVVHAAMGLVAAGGRSAVTARALAAATGRPVGTIRHYVPSDAALERLLLDHVSGRVQERVAEVIHACDSAGAAAIDSVVRQLEQILPLDDTRTTEYRVWLSIYVMEAERADELRWAWEGQRMFFRQHVLRLMRAATIPGLPGALDEPFERLAGLLHAYIDGLALRIASRTEEVAVSLRELRGVVGRVETEALAAVTASRD